MVAKVAAMAARDVDRLVQGRPPSSATRAKIEATPRQRARAMMSASPSLAALAKSYEVQTQAGTADSR